MKSRYSPLWLLVLLLVGCRPPELDVTYGKRRGSPGASSVNGTAVFAGMFEAAGHRVLTWRRLSPKLEEFDTIVWFPDSFPPPSVEQRRFLENWLASEEGRTLVYVGRDYDAAVDYWRRMLPAAPPQQAVEIARRAAAARALHDERRATIPDGKSNDWFTVQTDLPHREVSAVRGPWSEGIEAAKLDMKLDSRLMPPTPDEIAAWQERDGGNTPGGATIERLLSTPDDPLVTRLSFRRWGDSQILVVANGSFLLNLPLVNHEHRKLAGKLINACGPPGRVAFLESDESGPMILEHEPGAQAPTGFEVFTVWPIGVILLHLAALGVLTCITLFPVFGRARELPPADTSDFGQHVTALGELLELTGDRDYAVNRIRQYHESITAKSGRKTPR